MKKLNAFTARDRYSDDKLLKSQGVSTDNRHNQNMVRLSAKATSQILNSINKFKIDDHGLTTVEVGEILIPQDAALIVNRALPIVVEALFNKSNGVLELACENFLNILRVLTTIIAKGTLEEIVITIGLGASEGLPSIRLPSYILPVIKVLESISYRKLNIGLPTVRIFKATHAGVYANGMNLEKAKQITKYTLSFLSDFVKTFYPKFSNHFVFESDNDFENTNSYSTIIGTSNLIRNLTGIENELSSLRKMGKKHGGKHGETNAFFYAAAHPFYNQAIISKDHPNWLSRFVFENPLPQLILDFGGRPQKIFNRIISALRSKLSANCYFFPPLVNIIIKTGKVPVYYMARHGDILISDKINSFDDYEIDPLTQLDYEFLFEEITDFDYLKFIHSFQQNN